MHAFCWTGEALFLSTTSPRTKVSSIECTLGLPPLPKLGFLLEAEHFALRVNVILQLPGEE